MARTNDVNAFFISYEPGDSGRAQRTSTKTSASWQKHASREYHRKVRLKKASNAQRLRGQRSSNVDPYAYKARSILPRTNQGTTAEPGFCQGILVPPIISKVVGGQLDPFGVAVRSNTSKYAIEMLHHGKTSPPIETTVKFNHLLRCTIKCSRTNISEMGM